MQQLWSKYDFTEDVLGIPDDKLKNGSGY